jgi:heme exporter protein D
MNWHSSAEFFAMGGYGLYVWGAYAVTALAMGLEVASVVHRRRRAAAQALQWSESETGT